MSHPIHRVESFDTVDTFVLTVHFKDGTSQEIDFEPVLKGEIFGPLTDPQLFSQVRVDTEADTLVWPNGADFDPAILHDWPEHKDTFAAMAARWEAAMAR